MDKYKLILLYTTLSGWQEILKVFGASKKAAARKGASGEYYTFDKRGGRIFWAMKHYHVHRAGLAPAHIAHELEVSNEEAVIEVVLSVKGSPEKSWDFLLKHAVAIAEVQVIGGGKDGARTE